VEEDLRRRVRERAAAQHGAIATRQILELGGTRRSVRTLHEAGELVLVTKGVSVVAGSPATWKRRLMIGVLDAGPAAAVCGFAAAALLGLLGFARRGVEVVRPGTGPSYRTATATVHRSRRLLPHHVTVVDGIPCTTVPRTVFDLIGRLRPQRAERLVDDCLTAKRLSVAELDHMVEDLAKRGRRGSALARQFVDDRRKDAFVPTATQLERRVRRLLERAGVTDLEREVDIAGEYELTHRVDFREQRPMIIYEADGRTWHESLRDAENDKWRDMRAAAKGYVTIRISWRQATRRADDVVDLVRRTRRARLRQLGAVSATRSTDSGLSSPTRAGE
jgi:very-short-patch-repair endonuclease